MLWCRPNDKHKKWVHLNVIWQGKQFTAAMEIAVQNRNLRHLRLLSDTSQINLNVSAAAFSSALLSRVGNNIGATQVTMPTGEKIGLFNGGNITTFPVEDHGGRRRKPYLVHGCDPHKGEAQAHQCTAAHHDQGKWMIEFSEIPRAYIHYYGNKR